MSDEKSISSSGVAPVEVMPTVTAAQGIVPEGKLEKAISAILFGVTLLEESQTQDPEISAFLKTKARDSVKHLESLLVPSIYQGGEHWNFTLPEQRLMQAISETGDFHKSCLISGMSPDQAGYFFARGKFPRYFSERVKEAAIRRGWTVDHFFSELNKVWTGEVEKTREQMDAIKELGARVAPKIERVQHEFDASDFVFETKE